MYIYIYIYIYIYSQTHTHSKVIRVILHTCTCFVWDKAVAHNVTKISLQVFMTTN